MPSRLLKGNVFAWYAMAGPPHGSSAMRVPRFTGVAAGESERRAQIACAVLQILHHDAVFGASVEFPRALTHAGSSGGTAMKVRPGQPYPLGATWDGVGVNFALFSEHATSVELCLFDGADATAESVRITLPEQTDRVWHGYVSGIRPGQLYGYRVDGPYEPHAGHRFNRAKVLLDAYAKAIGRTTRWGDENFGYVIGDPTEDLSHDDRDNAALAPLAAVVDSAFTWGDDRPPRTPWHETVIYELHVKGFTHDHPDVPEALRGTYAGLVSEAAIG